MVFSFEFVKKMKKRKQKSKLREILVTIMEELARMYLNGLELHTTISNNIVTELYEFQLTFLLYLDKALHIQLFLFLNLKKYKIKQKTFFSFF